MFFILRNVEARRGTTSWNVLAPLVAETQMLNICQMEAFWLGNQVTQKYSKKQNKTMHRTQGGDAASAAGNKCHSAVWRVARTDGTGHEMFVAFGYS